MFAKLNLQQKLVSAFSIVVLIVLAAAFVGYRGTQVLSDNINILTRTSLPSIQGIWKINRGQTQIESSERLLLVPEILPAQRQAALNKIDQAWEQIHEGFNLVEETLFKNETEKIIYQKFIRDWNIWQKAHQEFIQLEQKYDKLGIRNPEKFRADLLVLGQQFDPEMKAASSALVLRTKLYQSLLKEEPLSQNVTDSISQLLASSENFSTKIQKNAEEIVDRTKVWVVSCLLMAIIYSIFISIKLANSLQHKNQSESQILRNMREHHLQIVERKDREIMELQQHLNLVQTQLIQSEKMSSLGQMMAGLAHEINNPINFIYGNLTHASDHIEDLMKLLQIYQRQYPHPATQIQKFSEEIDVNFIADDLPKMFSSMKLGADRIRQIISFLRNFSRIDEAEMQALNINEAIEASLLILNHRLKRGIEIIKNYGNLPLIDCYKNQINLVFMNILGNAIDALLVPTEKTSKKIVIQTEFLLGEELIKIKIRDNGLGISAQIKDKIFEPFFTTKPVGQGSGLGLYICYKIVQKHGGKIELFSEPGRGTEFGITLPIKRTV